MTYESREASLKHEEFLEDRRGRQERVSNGIDDTYDDMRISIEVADF